MIISRVKKQIENDTEENKVKQALRGGFANLGKINRAFEDSAIDSVDRDQNVTKANILQILIETAQREKDTADEGTSPESNQGQIISLDVPNSQYKIKIFTIAHFS